MGGAAEPLCVSPPAEELNQICRAVLKDELVDGGIVLGDPAVKCVNDFVLMMGHSFSFPPQRLDPHGLRSSGMAACEAPPESGETARADMNCDQRFEDSISNRWKEVQENWGFYQKAWNLRKLPSGVRNRAGCRWDYGKRNPRKTEVFRGN